MMQYRVGETIVIEQEAKMTKQVEEMDLTGFFHHYS
jgi:hypothetical protein